MKTYMVSVEADGSFRAEELVGFEAAADIFQCKYWYVFEKELKRRLLRPEGTSNEKNQNIREAVTVEKERKGDSEIF